MEEPFEIENISLLKLMESQKSQIAKDSDPVRGVERTVLAPVALESVLICLESLDKKKMPTLALANGLDWRDTR